MTLSWEHLVVEIMSLPQNRAKEIKSLALSYH